ncbi:MAG: SURF1 family protein [Pseudomonadota bacterium]
MNACVAVRDPPARRALPVWTAAFAALLAVACVGFVALGVWQLERREWKHALIARVESRIHAEPSAPPSRAEWSAVSDAGDGYRRVRLTGRFLAVPETRTQAVTALGAGAWVLAPLRTDAGDIVFVNRGFVPIGETAAPPPAGRVDIVGLLRIGEPDGGFLRRNDPAAGRWYSRDVAAIARRLGLPAPTVAPFFVDAEAVGADPQAWPRGGLTVVRFRDAHLSYALTWFGMAALTLVAAGCLLVSWRRLRQDRPDTSVR